MIASKKVRTMDGGSYVVDPQKNVSATHTLSASSSSPSSSPSLSISQIKPTQGPRRPLEVSQTGVQHQNKRAGDGKYVAPPLFNTTTVFSFAVTVVVLSKISTVLTLIMVWVGARLQRYWFRINDDASMRRRLLRDFLKRDKITTSLRRVPDCVDFRESSWTNRRGMSLMTCVMTPKHTEVKSVVCFAHGYGDAPTMSRRRELARMVKQGIAVIMIEYEGHGRSDGTLGLITDWDKLVDDVSSFFEQSIRALFPKKPIFLMGESMGGAVAYCTYNRNPKLYQGVVFCAPMCKIADELLPAQWVIDLFRVLAGPKGTASTLGYLPIAPSQGVDPDHAVRPHKQEMFYAFPFDYGRKPRLATARELLDVTLFLSKDLKNFDAPFLIVHGKADRVTDPKLSEFMYHESKSTDKTIKLYDGMIHAILSGEFDENIDMVFNDCIDWILQRSTGVVVKES